MSEKIKNYSEFINESVSNSKEKPCVSVDYKFYSNKQLSELEYEDVNKVDEIIPYFKCAPIKFGGKIHYGILGKYLTAVGIDVMNLRAWLPIEIRDKSGNVLFKDHLSFNYIKEIDDVLFWWSRNDERVGKTTTTVGELSVYVDNKEISKVNDPFLKKGGGKMKYQPKSFAWTKFSGSSSGNKLSATKSGTFTIEKNGIVTFVVDDDENTKINKRDALVKEICQLASKVDGDNGYWIADEGGDTPTYKGVQIFLKGYANKTSNMENIKTRIESLKKGVKLPMSKATEKQISYATSLCDRDFKFDEEKTRKLMDVISKEHLSQLINVLKSYNMNSYEIDVATNCYNHYIDWYKIK